MPKTIIYITEKANADEIFDLLIAYAQNNKHIICNGVLSNHLAYQACATFIERYRMFIKDVKIDFKNLYQGSLHIKLKRVIPEKRDEGYAELASDYSEEYYMNDCGGYESFKASGGKQIDRRLEEVAALVCPAQGDTILDVGCGRGELTHYMACKGANCVGLDYSEDSIRIARRAFGDSIPNLRFVNEDIFKAENLDEFDKVVMADVVEHIQQDVLEAIFNKLSESMNSQGRLVIHTAPNNLYYEVQYQKNRLEAAGMGLFLPKEPRSYYEQLMHINEQTRESLLNALCKAFPVTKVWTGSIFEIDVEKSLEDQARDGQIFAIACKNQDAMDKALAEICKKPIQEDLKVKITAEDIYVKRGEDITEIKVEVENLGDEAISSGAFYPFHLSYHIYDMDGNTVFFDGNRADIQIAPGQKVSVPLLLTGLGCVTNRGGTIKLTLVAEGCFWAEADEANTKTVEVNVCR